MKSQLENIKALAVEELTACTDLKTLEGLRVKYLGKKGELTAILKQMGKLSAEERPVIGQLANEVRAAIEAVVEATEKNLKDEAKKKDADFYARIINKLTESNINCLIDGSGLPAASVENGRIVFKDNIGARQNRMRRESTNAAIDDRTIETNAIMRLETGPATG